MKKTHIFLGLIIAILISIPGIHAQASDKSLKMATTTSTDGTGLLDYLIPQFKNQTGIALEWIPTGTGNALKLGQDCNVDVLLVHAPEAEAAFIKSGFGKDRKQIMYNDFVIIGPESDPAGIKGKKVSDALDIIRTGQAVFVSRGDDSGTHKKEKQLWQSTRKPLPEKEAWYLQIGKGMQATILLCEEKKGYTMTDRGSYIKYQSVQNNTAPLKILIEGDDILLNQYSVLTLDPKNCPHAKYDLALEFLNWMASPGTQKLIGDFKLLGQTLFVPNAQ
ncbi:MAG: substrate-binding domain-containing protein [Proteobacteria bacterium]|nr:substrate-binding domain-containing protein [Pseudomonadota bacterium]MBU1388024.1 substrate-binding domain-containing protein [Pseudomonadota bacterium]MBU1542087.1 substrate-binding domain-containing protein [Pseudomonadota bacterium]MBU2482871.1 substrate-binding domain-containing protein [Pseudomonadota bacterium]